MTAVLETAAGPTLKSSARRARGPVAAVVALVVLALLVVLVGRSGNGARLDPRSYAPGGSHALAAVLAERGTPVQVEDSVDAAVRDSGDRTVLVVPFPEVLSDSALQDLAGARGGLLLVDPDDDALDALQTGVSVNDPLGSEEVRSPGCDLPAATGAGRARVGGTGYEGGTRCYGGSLVVTDRAIVLGSSAPLTNVRLDQDGNAALALGLLGPADRVLWLLPTATSGSRERKSIVDLLPRWTVFGLLQLAVAVVVLGLWRARRLGRVVSEPLPVVVRAAETVEGRGRLYRRARAHDRAAEVLRGAVVERSGRRLALGPRPEQDSLVAAVAERSGRSPSEVTGLLYGPTPADDASLVRLADSLAQLERQLRADPPDQEVSGP